MTVPPLAASHPILTCSEAREFEAAYFGGDEAREWPAMQAAGRAVARGILRDAREIGGLPGAARLLVLVGKGHNGGDALIAAQALLGALPAATADVVFVFGVRALRPLAARAWRDLQQAAGSRVTARDRELPSGATRYDASLDGVFGFQFRPPADPAVLALFAAVDALPIGLRAAVDLPSADRLCADFTYATGILKTPVLESAVAGRIRYLDLGFFAARAMDPVAGPRVLTPAVLAPLAGLRPSVSDKRTYGHLMIVGGSRSFPGAVLLAVQAALRSGAGLVTAFVPESVAPAFAAQAPEAMWVAWPETPSGGLALEGEHLLRAKWDRATALVIGPGLGREPETLALARSIVAHSPVPLVIDADALQPEIVAAGSMPRILTPHAGEAERIGSAPVSSAPTVTIFKGPRTRIAASGGGDVYVSPFGGPVLARGGSGDLLAGLTGGLLAQTSRDPLLAAARGAVWHGLAADTLARTHGQVAVTVVQLLDFLGAALRESADAS